ncbi:MAG: winged helix-turn-helix domain-containing protein [Acidimicrobiia bacterium]|nr:winged helix-turn-helix domain-containing protein [Acidimicrobiia bacterium]
MLPEVRIEHRYPQALRFLREHGPQALAVLQDLIVAADEVDGALIAAASTREIAERLEFLSKDSVHRRLRQLIRAGVVVPVPSHPTATFASPRYRLLLDDSGIARVLVDRTA